MVSERDRVETGRILYITNPWLSGSFTFESGNNILMEHLTRSTKRFLQINNNYFETEKLFIKHLTLVLKAPDKQTKQQAFVKMAEEIDSLFTTNEHEKIALDSLRVSEWVRAKIANKPFGAYIESLS